MKKFIEGAVCHSKPSRVVGGAWGSARRYAHSSLSVRGREMRGCVGKRGRTALQDTNKEEGNRYFLNALGDEGTKQMSEL